MIEADTVLIEAESLEEARQNVNSKLPEGFYIIATKVLSDGIPKNISSTGDTVEEAFLVSEKKIPLNATVKEKKEIMKPSKRILEVKVFNEHEAEELFKKQLSKYEIVKSVELKERGRKGFFGIGTNPSIYVATIVSPAVVEVTYRELAKIQIKMKKRPSKLELMNSLDELERQTTLKFLQLERLNTWPTGWLGIDQTIQGNLAALEVMTAALKFLRKKALDPFNIILTEAKILFVKDENLKRLVPLKFVTLKLDPFQDKFYKSDIPLVLQQFKEAITIMKQLREAIKQAK